MAGGSITMVGRRDEERQKKKKVVMRPPFPGRAVTTLGCHAAAKAARPSRRPRQEAPWLLQRCARVRRPGCWFVRGAGMMDGGVRVIVVVGRRRRLVVAANAGARVLYARPWQRIP